VTSRAALIGRYAELPEHGGGVSYFANEKALKHACTNALQIPLDVDGKAGSGLGQFDQLGTTITRTRPATQESCALTLVKDPDQVRRIDFRFGGKVALANLLPYRSEGHV
jgi:hypothetical protein